MNNCGELILQFVGMNGQEIIKTEKVVLKIEYLPSLNYSMLNNGVETCFKCVISNVGHQDWHQIQITIRGDLKNIHNDLNFSVKDNPFRLTTLKSYQTLKS